jgi:hypothetical protein
MMMFIGVRSSEEIILQAGRLFRLGACNPLALEGLLPLRLDTLLLADIENQRHPAPALPVDQHCTDHGADQSPILADVVLLERRTRATVQNLIHCPLDQIPLFGRRNAGQCHISLFEVIGTAADHGLKHPVAFDDAAILDDNDSNDVGVDEPLPALLGSPQASFGAP